MMKTEHEIFETLRQIMSELFELDPEVIVMQAHLSTDLDIDSIDAVDLMVRLRDLTGKRINPEDFKNARTIGDVVQTMVRISNE